MQETFLINGSSYGHVQPYNRSHELELTLQCVGCSSVLTSGVLGVAM